MNTLYLDLRMGAAGDMLTASLFELLPAYKQDEFLDTMNNLGLARVAVCALPKSDKGVNGTHMEVTISFNLTKM